MCSSNSIPVGIFPRSSMNMDKWSSQPQINSNANISSSRLNKNPMSSLEMFDPFDDLDRLMSRNLHWINRPQSMVPSQVPKVPRKYRITLDCVGFNPDTIKTDIKTNKDGLYTLVVTGKDDTGIIKGYDDFCKKEFKRTFLLPKHVDVEKLCCFMAESGLLVIEFPLKESFTKDKDSLVSNSLLQQQNWDKSTMDKATTDKFQCGKNVCLKFSIPANLDPSKIQVTVKDHDLIVQVEDDTVSPNSVSCVHIYSRCTLPDRTDLNALKCLKDNEFLIITAPYLTTNNFASLGNRLKRDINVPIETTSGKKVLDKGFERFESPIETQKPGQVPIGKTPLEEFQTVSSKSKKNKGKK